MCFRVLQKAASVAETRRAEKLAAAKKEAEAEVKRKLEVAQELEQASAEKKAEAEKKLRDLRMDTSELDKVWALVTYPMFGCALGRIKSVGRQCTFLNLRALNHYDVRTQRKLQTESCCWSSCARSGIETHQRQAGMQGWRPIQAKHPHPARAGQGGGAPARGGAPLEPKPVLR